MEVLVLATFIVAKLRGYKLTPVFKDWPVYPLVVSQLLTAVLYVFSFAGGGSKELMDVLGISSLVLFVVSMFAFFIKYKQLRDFIISIAMVAAGLAVKQITINANSGKMPVFPSLSKLTRHLTPEAFAQMYQANPIHIWGDETAKLKPLTAWIDFGYDIHSVGDMFILFIPVLVVYSTIKQLNKNNTALN